MDLHLVIVFWCARLVHCHLKSGESGCTYACICAYIVYNDALFVYVCSMQTCMSSHGRHVLYRVMSDCITPLWGCSCTFLCTHVCMYLDRLIRALEQDLVQE